MRKYSLVLSAVPFLMCLAVALNAWAGEPRVLTLEQALEIASERNRDIQKAREYFKWVEGKYVEERSAALPQLTMTGFVARDRNTLEGPASGSSRGVELGLRQAVFTWGQVGAAIRAAEKGFLVAEEQLRLYRQAAFREVAMVYYDLLLADELRKIAGQNLGQKERHLEEAKRKFQAGVATDYDVLAAQVAVENSRPDVIRASNQVQSVGDRLRFLLALDNETVAVSGGLQTELEAVLSYDEVYNAALRRRPELKDIRCRIGISEELVTISSAGDKPRLDLLGGYGRRWYGNGEAGLDGAVWNVGLYMTFPFFDGLRTNGKKAQAESDRNGLRTDEAKLLDTVALQSRDALNAVRESEEIVRALTGTVAQAERLLNMSEKGYELGVKIRLEVEDAELNLQQARANLSRAWRDYRVASINLKWVMGALGEKG